ncbi:MAG: hypothetical protein RBR42_13025 [Desulfomicrobium sp.]|nr:hypothetical protein [Desulfomicrobium sp.]
MPIFKAVYLAARYYKPFAHLAWVVLALGVGSAATLFASNGVEVLNLLKPQLPRLAYHAAPAHAQAGGNILIKLGGETPGKLIEHGGCPLYLYALVATALGWGRGWWYGG